MYGIICLPRMPLTTPEPQSAQRGYDVAIHDFLHSEGTVHLLISLCTCICNINRHMYITNAGGHELSGCVFAHVCIYMCKDVWAECMTWHCFQSPPLSETIKWCSLKSATTTLGLSFSWLHLLHCTVVFSLGNLASLPSSSCLVHMILYTMIMQFYY